MGIDNRLRGRHRRNRRDGASARCLEKELEVGAAGVISEDPEDSESLAPELAKDGIAKIEDRVSEEPVCEVDRG